MKTHELEALVKTYAWFWGNLHQRWRAAIEEMYGLDAAVSVELRMMESIGRRHASELKKIFGEVKGVSGFMKLFGFLPENLLENFEVVKLDENEAIFRNSSCSAQKARLKKNLPEYPCKEPGLIYFKAFATEIDPELRIGVITAPPDLHPDDCWCEWRVYIEK
ncbi:MAG: hypothetical protein SCAL_000969 [Candidatus Syntrophoarchaeum caldarius]|uniref:L-2-amino-thiazoline-4-carboxylic acid hydrolase n=1 Tax=Candidatus Syntropharchaeum caldarium TaxID=1838285 RepID=A0A1F2P928_9EURY|nr:MAG: hypothetical protein SCAL_000969 [Candidatus Syntrophoarchaeum caldarius]